MSIFSSSKETKIKFTKKFIHMNDFQINHPSFPICPKIIFDFFIPYTNLYGEPLIMKWYKNAIDFISKPFVNYKYVPIFSLVISDVSENKKTYYFLTKNGFRYVKDGILSNYISDKIKVNTDREYIVCLNDVNGFYWNNFGSFSFLN